MPLSEKRARLTLHKVYPEKLAVQIKDGFEPREMQDKWLMFYEDDTLFIHRSWTGICIYKVYFMREGDALRATHAYVTRDKEQYRSTSDEKDIETIYWLIDTFLLNK